MKNHLIDFKEFKKSNTETSNYEPPKGFVLPLEDDKIWNYVEDEIKNGPLWGFDLKSQEFQNKILGKRISNEDN